MARKRRRQNASKNVKVTVEVKVSAPKNVPVNDPGAVIGPPVNEADAAISRLRRPIPQSTTVVRKRRR